MALKPTIFKLKIALSDLNRNHYDTLNLVVAQHPSEKLERMMARVLAYCLNVQEDIMFTRGLSATDEADVWVQTLEERLLLWIDVGEPSVDRIKKACRSADAVKIYSFNTKSQIWWEQIQKKVAGKKAHYYRFQWETMKELAKLVTRTMDMSVTISDQSIYVATEDGECDVALEVIHDDLS